MLPPTIDDVREAYQAIRTLAKITPLIEATELGAQTGQHLFLKLESLQATGSFKIRGALNALLHFSPEEQRRGAIAASSGNHGKAVAYAARYLGIPAVIVVPEDVSPPKAQGILEAGAELHKAGRFSAERFAYAHRLVAERGLRLVHSYDDPHVIAGQGTIGLEILEQLPDASAVLVPMSGGGLISGIALAIKSLAPRVRVVGVEPQGANRFQRSLAAGRRVALERAETVADGLRVLEPGELTFALVSRYVDEVVTVTDEEILEAVRKLLRYARVLAEPSGAASVAAALFGKVREEGKVVAVISGGNIDPQLLRSIL
ncbi:MAG: threonine/serine dehydratase [Armatimonadota bacterium]|nr:threonine/serine dehydratase [Armatimonadota bacterium]MDR5702551.1 threonine/serine dehydratase [Armatimonadota bacterium]